MREILSYLWMKSGLTLVPGLAGKKRSRGLVVARSEDPKKLTEMNPIITNKLDGRSYNSEKYFVLTDIVSEDLRPDERPQGDSQINAEILDCKSKSTDGEIKHNFTEIC